MASGAGALIGAGLVRLDALAKGGSSDPPVGQIAGMGATGGVYHGWQDIVIMTFYDIWRQEATFGVGMESYALIHSDQLL